LKYRAVVRVEPGLFPAAIQWSWWMTLYGHFSGRYGTTLAPNVVSVPAADLAA
jgi:hypothetical protein